MLSRIPFSLGPAALVAPVLLLVAACSDQPMPTGLTPSSPQLSIASFGSCSPFQPIAWYPLDNHGNDASGNGNDGTMVGASPAANRYGTPSTALSFDGVDDVIQLGERFNTLPLPVSVAAWIYQPAAARGQFRAIFATDDQAGRYFGISLQLDPAGNVAASYGSGGLPGPMSRRTIISNAPVPTDSWVHVAATMRGATDMTLYVNGVAVPGTYSGTGGPLVQSLSAPARIGVITNNPENRPWLGRLDDVRLFNCSLEADAVAALLNPTPVGDAGGEYTGDEGSPISFDGTGSSDPDGEAIVSYAWTFGDGETGSGPNPQHTYADDGTYSVTLVVTDASGATSDPAPTTVTVSNVAPTATFNAPASVGEGSPIVLSLTDATDVSSADRAAGFTYAFNCGTGYGAFGAATTASCPTTDDGTRTVGAKVRDKNFGEREYPASVEITNLAPVVTVLGLPSDPVAVGMPVPVSASFVDAGRQDSHVASFNPGDGGTPVTGAVSESDGSGTASATVTYSQPGVYTVGVTVTDNGGASGSRSSAQDDPSYVVVYDPGGGFVTGGGWIWSPAGALTSAPTASGKASFGFVARYRTGASIPSGNTEFQFKAGDLTFRSTSYEWLVVAGDRAKFKGEGTIGGTGRYGFMLTAIDGDLQGSGRDAFRIQIWNLLDGSIVYDNNFADGGDDATALGGGSIVIHK